MPHLHSTPPLGESPSQFCYKVWYGYPTDRRTPHDGTPRFARQKSMYTLTHTYKEHARKTFCYNHCAFLDKQINPRVESYN